MTIKTIINELNLEILTCKDSISKKITDCYIGDLLSWVMAKAKQGDIWITVMGNINAIAVAVLKDIPCILLSENAALDDDARQRAEQNDVVILRSSQNSYCLAKEISKILS